MQRTITPRELEFNRWYYSNMERLGLLVDLEESITTELYPFKNIQEYTRAKTEAIKLLMAGKPVPKDLEEKLLEMKRLQQK